MEGRFNVYFYVKGCAMAQAVSRRFITTDNRVKFQATPCEICGGKSGTGTDFFPPEYFGSSLSVPFHRCYVLVYSSVIDAV
jgi:hypothetical protein